MTIDDHSTLAFELILQPASLPEKLLSRQKNGNDSKNPDPVIMAVLNDFLHQLQSSPNLSNQIEPGSVPENSQRKRSYIQLMVLQIHAFYSWDLDIIQKFLPLNLQSQLLETLLCICGKAQNVFLTNKEGIAAGEALPLKDFEKNTVFAIQLFLRWVLKTLPTLNDPVPPGNKIQLYGISFGAGGGTGGIPQEALGQLSNLRFTAVKTMETLIPKMTSVVPSQQSFRVNQTSLETECQNDFGWKSLEDCAMLAQTLFDLAAYHFFIESYTTCRKYLWNLSKINNAVLKKYIDVDMMKGYEIAVAADTNDKTIDDETADERRVNVELQAWANKSREQGKKLGDANIGLRLSKSYPPNFEFFNQGLGANIQATDFKSQFFKSLCLTNESINYDSERPVLTEKMPSKSSSKQHPKLRKHETLCSLLRERNPEKIAKMVLDLAKSNITARRLVFRWQVAEAQKGILQSLSGIGGSGSRPGPEADLVFILLSKLKQIVDLKCYNDTPNYFNTILRLTAEKIQREKIKPIEININVQVMYMKMLQFNDNKIPREDKMLPANFVQKSRDCFEHILSSTSSSSTHDCIVMEEVIATLLNLGEFEFLLSRGGDKLWKLIELACHISTLVLHFRGKQNLAPAEFKKTLKNLEEILITVAQSGVGIKKSRDLPPSVSNSSLNDKRLVISFVSKFRHPDVTDLVKAFLVSCFNSSVTDSMQAIQCDLLTLPVSAKNTNLNTDLLLSLLIDMTESTTDGYRVRAEIHFARGNYRAAMQNYLECLVISTNYFNKPWIVHPGQPPDWDERIFQKMVKCTSEMGHHLETAVLCQFLNGDCEYSTAFKAMEERNSNDAMDKLYDFIWDVTLLEYLVSMHAKRGEFSRKRKALDTISQLEINTNNNEEILREARATRRSAYMRYLCTVFL